MNCAGRFLAFQMNSCTWALSIQISYIEREQEVATRGGPYFSSTQGTRHPRGRVSKEQGGLKAI